MMKTSDIPGRQIDADDDPVVCRLRKLQSVSPELKEPALAYEVILPLLKDTDLNATPVSMSASEAVEKMRNGLFLLDDLELELDIEAFRSLMVRLAEALENLGQERYHPASAAREIRKKLEDGSLDISGLLMFLSGEEESPADIPEELDTDLLMTLGRNALRPAFREWHRQLAPLVDPAGWGKGYCFVCGATATLAELRGNNQSRHLRCGQCGADWPVPRLQCIYCGNDHHHSLGFLYAESQNDHARVEVCDKCSGYIKLISSFDPLPSDLLAVEDLATLRLDFISTERGYRHGHQAR